MSEPSSEKPDRNDPNNPAPRFGGGMILWLIVIGIGLMLILSMSNGLGDRRLAYIDQFWTYVENGQIQGKIVVQPKRIDAENTPDTPGLKSNEPRKFYVQFDYTSYKDFVSRLEAAQKKFSGKFEVEYSIEGSWWRDMLPQLLLTMLLIAAIWFFLFRRIGGGMGGGGFLGNFGRSRHRLANKERPKVTFNDVAGIEDAKSEVAEVIEFLRDPKKFQRLGGRVPRGVLLVGEPGCGKTMLAKAIAGEADVPFFSISGSDFVELFVGVGASRVRDLFRQAKDSAPCIIFLDEIDAIGRRRGVGFNGGGHDEREQTLNAILVEMDGFDSSDQVIVIAATNRADVLDPALTRPGRFDRQITVPLPDLPGRKQILKIYIDKVRCGSDVDIDRLARGTPMFSGADLAAMVNEAAIAATMANKDFIEHEDLEEARDKVRWGRARKSRAVDEKEKEITAYHEAGHALVQVLSVHADPLHKVSIIPRGPYGGATFSLPEKDRYLYTRNYCRSQLQVLFGGRIAEEKFCSDISSGASADIAQATALAKKMVCDWGMSDKIGTVRLSPDDRGAFLPDMGSKEYSERTAESIDAEIHRIINEAYAAAENVISSHASQMKSLAKALLKYETLGADEVKAIVDGKSIDKPTVGELLDIEQSKAAPPSGTVEPPALPKNK